MKIRNKQKRLILIAVILIVFIGVLVMIFSPSKQQVVDKNIELNGEKMSYLLKHVQQDLNTSSNLEINSFTDASMVKFSLAYMEVTDEYKKYIKYDKENSLDVAIVDINKLSETINYIFGKENLKFEELGYKISESNIYIPKNMQGGDVEIYKYKSTEYIEEQKVYISYVDCLELSGDDKKELLEESQTTYDEEDVVATLIFKYKVDGDRKILLSYNATVNY